MIEPWGKTTDWHLTNLLKSNKTIGRGLKNKKLVILKFQKHNEIKVPSKSEVMKDLVRGVRLPGACSRWEGQQAISNIKLPTNVMLGSAADICQNWEMGSTKTMLLRTI